MGHFTFYLTINKFLNMEVPTQLFTELGDDIKCGWKSVHCASGSLYASYKQPAKKKVIVNKQCRGKRWGIPL